MRRAGSPDRCANARTARVHRDERRATACRSHGALRCGAARASVSQSPEGPAETDRTVAALRRCSRDETEPPRSQDWRESAGMVARHFGAPWPAGSASPLSEGPSAEPNLSDIARWRRRWVRGRRVNRAIGERTRRQQLPSFGKGAGRRRTVRNVVRGSGGTPRQLRTLRRARKARVGRRGRETDRRRRQASSGASAPEEVGRDRCVTRGTGSGEAGAAGLRSGGSAPGSCRGPRTGE